MKVAAPGSLEALDLIRERVAWCESEGVCVLCCPEAILGGLADYWPSPAELAIGTDNGELPAILAPLASKSVTSIVGFTEVDRNGQLYNSAAIFHLGRVAGVYRKLHPAIRRSVYCAGIDIPVFQVEELIFGVVICNDSNFSEPAQLMAARGATVLLLPTNNGLPMDRASTELAAEARTADIARARENRMWVIRADVAGQSGQIMSYGTSEIVDPSGSIVAQAKPLTTGILVTEIRASKAGSDLVQSF